jgi:hypothetical protein
MMRSTRSILALPATSFRIRGLPRGMDLADHQEILGGRRVMSVSRHTARLAASLVGLMFAAAGGPAGANGQQTETAAKDAQASLVTVPPEVPADAARYSILLAGNKAGVLALWSTPDGARHNFFAFNDRGRGPSLTTRIVVDGKGIPTEIDATGNDYYKGPVDERFRLASPAVCPSRPEWTSATAMPTRPC